MSDISAVYIGGGGRLKPRRSVRLATATGVLLAALALAAPSIPADAVSRASPTVTFRLTGTTAGRVPAGYLGLSMEIRGVQTYTGYDPSAVNPVLVQLVKALDPAQRPVLRLAGEAGDWTWYPIPGAHHPNGVRFALTQNWFNVVSAFARATAARLLIGVNLETDSARVAAAEARAIITGLPAANLQALELGDEPDLYHVVPWYVVRHVPIFARPAGWNFAQYLSDYDAIRRALPNFPLAGPDAGQPSWLGDIGPFLHAEPHVTIATLHRYSLGCNPSSPATIGSLLSEPITRDFPAGLQPAITAAHVRHLPFRIDEMNTVSCGGQVGVSNTFASALWSLDVLFELASAGVDGVNMHTSQSTANQLFSFTRTGGAWQGEVAPQFYGLLAFARAAPPGARILATTAPATGPLHVWATRAPNGVERIVLINFSRRAGQTAVVQGGPNDAPATVDRLSAPGAGATTGVTLGGQRFTAPTSTGLLTGTPQITPVPRGRRGYTVAIPPASAAIVTLPNASGQTYLRREPARARAARGRGRRSL